MFRVMRSPCPARTAGVLATPALLLAGAAAACFFLFCIAASPATVRAQAPSPGGNLLGDNGGFEKIAGTEDNLWDGVNSEGILAVPTYSAQVVTDRAGYGSLAMPPSVAFADLNGDGKPDLLVAGPNGYFYYYQNRGTPTEPRFTNAEIVPIYLSKTFHPREKHFQRSAWDSDRFCPRIALADWSHHGMLDLLVGNYMGEVFFIPNVGSGGRAAFRQPTTLESVRVPTDEKGRLWGNLLSPVAYDWNGNGKLDLLLGEGTYSANAVRLLANSGGSTPQFTGSKPAYLAYGDGREQLIPAVVDYNGDGKPDLLVSDRSREIGVYLNTGEARATTELARSATITFGGNSKLPGFSAPCVADFNGDGLFDIILGLDNGHIGVALNTGTKEQPAFGPIRELKGEDRLGRNFKRPVGWNIQTHSQYGNALGYFSVVNAQDDPASAPPEGANCLKAGYWPAANDVFPMGSEGMPGAVRQFELAHPHLTLETNKNYTLSFKVKNTGMEKLHYGFYSLYDDYIGAVKQEVDDRNRKRRVGQHVVEFVEIGADFTGSGNWSTVTKTINVKYKNPDLQSIKTMSGEFGLEFWSRNASDVIYFDDFQLVEQKSH